MCYSSGPDFRHHCYDKSDPIQRQSAGTIDSHLFARFATVRTQVRYPLEIDTVREHNASGLGEPAAPQQFALSSDLPFALLGYNYFHEMHRGGGHEIQNKADVDEEAIRC